MTKMIVERILEDFLIENLNLIEPGLKLIERQFLMVGKGKVDLLCKDKNNKIVVIEIKKYASFSSIDQLISYEEAEKNIKEAIELYLEEYPEETPIKNIEKLEPAMATRIFL